MLLQTSTLINDPSAFVGLQFQIYQQIGSAWVLPVQWLFTHGSKSVVPFTTDSRNFVTCLAPWLKIASSNSSRSVALGRTVIVGDRGLRLVLRLMSAHDFSLWFVCNLVECRLKKIKHAVYSAGLWTEEMCCRLCWLVGRIHVEACLKKSRVSG